MPVIYRGKKIIPAPLCSISKSYNRADDGTIIGATHNITLNGFLVAFKGSPDSTGTFWTLSDYPPDETVGDTERLKSLLIKKRALKELFNNDGGLLEITPWDGSTPTMYAVKLIDITFQEGIWYDKTPYTISLESAAEIGVNEFTNYIKSAQENWVIEQTETPEGPNSAVTYKLSHTVSAVGQRVFDETGTLISESWEAARSFSQNRLGLDTTRIYASGALNLPSYYGGFNHARTENVDELGGAYSVTETWVIASGGTLEDFNVNTRTSIDTGLTNVVVEGNITGLDSRNANYQVTTTKWQNAQNKFTEVSNSVFSRAQTYSGVSLNGTALTSSVLRNPNLGTISYSYEYDNRFSNCIAGALSESITITDIGGGNLFAVIPIIGRRDGPIIQDLSSKTEQRRQLNIEARMPIVGTCSIPVGLSSKPTMSSIIESARPIANTVVSGQPQEVWNWKTGNYQYSIEWIYSN